MLIAIAAFFNLSWIKDSKISLSCTKLKMYCNVSTLKRKLSKPEEFLPKCGTN
jgi:hypothetical protein